MKFRQLVPPLLAIAPVFAGDRWIVTLREKPLLQLQTEEKGNPDLEFRLQIQRQRIAGTQLAFGYILKARGGKVLSTLDLTTAALIVELPEGDDGAWLARRRDVLSVAKDLPVSALSQAP